MITALHPLYKASIIIIVVVIIIIIIIIIVIQKITFFGLEYFLTRNNFFLSLCL